jgi:hypothetical protein
VPESTAIHLLPHFDCYVVGSFPRDRLIPATSPPELKKGTAAPFPVVLIDGVVAGLWDRQRHGRTLDVAVGAFSPLDAAQRQQVEQQVQRIGEILELKACASFAEVKAKGHL